MASQEKQDQVAHNSEHKYGDLNAAWQAQSDQDDNWGLPVKKLSKERISQLNAQARRESRLLPFFLLPLSLVVVVCSALWGLILAWNLNPAELEEYMKLVELSGSYHDLFGASTSAVVLNFSISALAGCLCYLLPCFVAHFVAFGRELLLERYEGSSALQNSYFARFFLMRAIWSEVCKFACMFILLGLCFKHSIASQGVIICSFSALILLSIVYSIARMVTRSHLSPEAAAALAAASCRQQEAQQSQQVQHSATSSSEQKEQAISHKD